MPSPIQRCRETAGIIGEVIHRVPVVDAHFKEMRLGPWEGLSETEVQSRFPKQWRLWNTTAGGVGPGGAGDTEGPSGESAERDSSDVGGEMSEGRWS